MLNPDELSERIFVEACGSLMAHTIRGTKNHFFRKGIILEVLVLRDKCGAVFRVAPHKASFLVTKFFPSVVPDPYAHVRAIIHLRRDANHHLSRLCIAHELFHALLALESFVAHHRKKWDGTWKKEHEPLCNRFSQELCRKHQAFYSNGETRANQIEFPAEIFAKGFALDLGDLASLPASIRPPGEI